MINGSVLAIGSNIVYIISFYRKALKYDVDEDTFFPIASINMIVSSLAMPLSMKAISLFGNRVKPVLAISNTLGIGMLLSCYFIQYRPIIFIIIFSVALGIIRGSNGSITLKAIMMTMPVEKRGMGLGICFTGFGLGAFLFSILIEQLTDPKDIPPKLDSKDGNFYFPIEVSRNYPFAQLVQCIIFTVLAILSFILI